MTAKSTGRSPAEVRPRYLISDLCVALESYLSAEQIREVYRSYVFSADAHEGQTRLTGEPYIYHPLAVARILAKMRIDHKCLMAAILHDVIEDTAVTKSQMCDEFGEEITELVDGVSKLSQMDFDSKAEAQAASFRKMLLAMTRDIRVILIKLADRLHNMRTLEVMRPEKCRRIAKETLDIYAPIANRLGIYALRTELEELGFAAYWPMRYRVLAATVRTARGNRKEVMSKIDTALRGRLEQEGFGGNVSGREKHLYSIYKKMRDKKYTFSEIVDVYAFRVIVDRQDTCYRVLGAVHNLYKPVPGRFKDYIAIPKANGYQSLHTVLFGPHGIPIEIQIRTEEMDRLAESGIAAHWLYKTDNKETSLIHVGAADWLKNLLELQQGAGDSMEFLEHVKVDLFPDEVYVFTPKGEIVVLAKGSTVVDFAYAVHSDVGNHCVATRIDRRLVPMRTRLYSGQTVEVITSESASPSAAWLNFVVTGKARAAIRNYLKNLAYKEAIDLGWRLLDQELAAYNKTLDDIPLDKVGQLIEDFEIESLEDLLEQIGLGNRMSMLVARRLLDGDESKAKASAGDRKNAQPLAIKGTEGIVVKFAKCCRPLPGDGIVAIFSPGKGIVVHRQECKNVGDLRKGDNWVDLHWAEEPAGDFTTEIKVDVGNKRGALASVASAISEMGANIENVGMEERDGLTSTLHFIVAVNSRKHLANIMRRLRLMRTVLRIYRMGV